MTDLDRLQAELQDWRDAHAVLHRAHREALARIEEQDAHLQSLQNRYAQVTEENAKLQDQTADTAPIARLTVDDSGLVVRAGLYAPGLPPGEHDVWPMGAAAEIERIDADCANLKAELEGWRRKSMGLERSLSFYRSRCEELQRVQKLMRDPERKAVCDILANGSTESLRHE